MFVVVAVLAAESGESLSIDGIGGTASCRRSCSKRSSLAIISRALWRRLRGGAGVVGRQGIPSCSHCEHHLYTDKNSQRFKEMGLGTNMSV